MKLALIGNAALMLCACSPNGTYPQQCDSPLPGWRQPHDGYGVLEITNRVQVSRDGTLKWNGEKVTDNELRTYSGMLPDLNPLPFTILEIEQGTSCDRARAVRQIVNDSAECRQLRNCGEGSGPWAQIGDVIGPNGETYKYHPDGRSGTMQQTDEQRAARNALLNQVDVTLEDANKSRQR